MHRCQDTSKQNWCCDTTTSGYFDSSSNTRWCDTWQHLATNGPREFLGDAVRRTSSVARLCLPTSHPVRRWMRPITTRDAAWCRWWVKQWLHGNAEKWENPWETAATFTNLSWHILYKTGSCITLTIQCMIYMLTFGSVGLRSNIGPYMASVVNFWLHSKIYEICEIPITSENIVR